MKYASFDVYPIGLIFQLLLDVLADDNEGNELMLCLHLTSISFCRKDIETKPFFLEDKTFDDSISTLLLLKLALHLLK